MIVISTAFKTAQIAVFHNDKKCLRELDANSKHSENVLKTLDEMLDEINVNIKEIDKFAVVIGPGSFTGLRIGSALVKGLCAGSEDKKVIPLSSFDLIAYSYIKHNTVKTDFIVVINALSGLVFICKYNAKAQPLSEGMLVSREVLDAMSEDKVSLEEDNLPYIGLSLEVEDLLELAKKAEKDGKFCDYKSLSPIYLRKSQAEDQLDAKNLKKS